MSCPEHDLDVELSRTLDGPPPRLQHSPSLPNLGTAPQNPQAVQARGHHSRRSSPTTHLSLDLSQIPDSPPASSMSAPITITTTTTTDDDPPPPPESKLTVKPKSHAHLITPPLTPSSSLKSDSSGGGGGGTAAETTNLEHVPASRFLVIGNIPRHVPTATLKTFFFSSFTSHSSRSKEPSPTSSSRSDDQQPHNPNDNPIKGVYVRSRPTQGFVVLAFFDLRDADRAKTAIKAMGGAEGGGDGGGAADLGEEWKRGLTCDFILPGELGKLIGKSSFVSETEGDFLVSSSSHASDHHHDGEVIQNRGIAPKSLKILLGSFGPLCRFESVANQQLGSTGTDNEAQVFEVEYYDVRDAEAANAALDGRTMLGVKLNLFPCDGGFRDSEAEEAEAYAYDGNSRHEERIRLLASLSHSPTATTTATTPSSIPFPSAPLQSHAPGDTDTDHDQFLVFDGTTAMGRPRSVSAGAGAGAGGDDGMGTFFDPAPGLGSDASYPPSPSVANPGTLYSSPPVSPAAAYIAPQPRGAGRRSSHQRFCEQRGGRPRSLNVDLPVDEQVAPAYSSAAYPPQPQQQQQQHTSYYYHATPHDPSPYYASYYNSNTTQVPPPAPLHFPLPPASPPNFGYHPEPMNLHTWTWATAAPPGTTGAAPAYYLSGGPSPPVASPHLGAVYYPPPQHISFVGRTRDQVEYDSAYLQQHSEHPLHHHPQRYPEFFPTTTSMFQQQQQQQPPSSPPLIPHMGSLLITESPDTSPSGLDTTPQMHPATSDISGQQTERNKLNIARIEDGQDTRTTVMVKNIPNKMSDADLIGYINNVCPKKIDFLYLRMDFQNGCNVGYAFVNFIYVEDLLLFAKSQLGVKWNMFSSEKVLQMSYANYQGKEALVEKFKNSCIMEERESWRPKIFYSEPGPKQGLLEPFPAPTHNRRKERSALNRGALFVSGSHQLHNVSNREQRSPSGGRGGSTKSAA